MPKLFTYLGQRREDVALELGLKREDGRKLQIKLTNTTAVDELTKQADALFAAE
ncbi:hypothetical protein VSH64_02080 [Amycolatopsis rhabdoformis]|uniref:Uncharacterized protein n=1 Tax=Amycolatopsis rhabdoformis TaxID=1448059 RepID=A0ABZ1IA32_9PSEU|nr:hypothetical protein [Amycolatopsis rhabdoformis]WSE30921.1 hypothetical protein VSH64_02080 [Amycolatopsis rhabdoformis]